MKKKILSVMLTVALILSFGLMAAPVMAAVPSPPTIDGVASFTEWQEATVIQVAGDMGTVKVIAYPDYLYMLFIVTDSTDARDGQPVGNDKIGVNINPTPEQPWGMPCDIIFQMGTDANSWNGVDCGTIDGYATDWTVDGIQVTTLPDDLGAVTLFSDGTRVTELKIPLSEASVSPGGTLQVGGVCDNLANSGSSYMYPPTLDWSNVATYAVIPVQNATSVGAEIVILEDLIQISVIPATLNFGEVYRGKSSAELELTIANTGSVSVLVSTSTSSAFYQAALFIDEVSVVTWNSPIASPGSISPKAQVIVPDNWASGVETGTIVFWAEAQ